jgi:16S rRNA (guanine527-N7)-methyltransferase
MANERELWRRLVECAGLRFDQSHHRKLALYLELLDAANQTMNLTRIRGAESAGVQHVGDALTVLPLLPPGPIRLADVGSGAGVPGLPLAIMRPDAEVVLIEATKKKAAFLARTAKELDLPNVRVIDQRAEEVATVYRATFDVAVSRAVAAMPWLAEWCLPLVQVGGRMLAMKGPKVMQELPAAARAIELLGGSEPVVHSADLPGAEGHVIVEIVKVRSGDERYPRLPSRAKGKPLV